MKSVRTEPRNHAAEGDERIRTAARSLGADYTYDPRRPRIVDLYCGAGGAAAGYVRAGFDVVGVDIRSQPRYPFRFEHGDALLWLRRYLYSPKRWRVDAFHASPPCQAYTRAGALRTTKTNHPDLIGPTRELLEATGLPYVIENVPGSPLRDPVQICNTGFYPRGNGLDWELQRHRLFEANWPLEGVACHHSDRPTISVVGHGATKATRTRLGLKPALAEQRQAMGIGWMNRDELSEAIPPIYARWVGDQLMDMLARAERDRG